MASELQPWEQRLAARNAKIAADNAEAERRELADKRRARLFRFLFWLGLAPFALFALIAMHESAWLGGYASGWRAGKAGEPFGTISD